MSRWEYQVIHLNVEDSAKIPQAPGPGPGPVTPPNQPPTPPAAETPPLTGQPVFSKAYLEQEFPDFYSNPPSQPPQGQQQANHPALQLQQFLNGHGQQGWSLVGIYPLGSLLMMFFRRRIAELPAPLIPAAAPMAQHQPPAPAGDRAPQGPAASMALPSPTPETSPSQAAELADPVLPALTDWFLPIMQRLDSLEGRIANASFNQAPSDPNPNPGVAKTAAVEPLAATDRQRSAVSGERRLRRRSSASQPSTSSPTLAPSASVSAPASAISPSGPPSQAVILSANLLVSLQEEVGMPTSHAAKALNFRSYATLAGYGSRHGYPLGLVKEGPNQMAAVYVGMEQGDRVGRARRLWVVVPVARLRSLES